MAQRTQEEIEEEEWWQRQQDKLNRMYKQKRIVYFVPCGAKKLTRRARARELYTGSMFQSALRSAEALGDGEIFILSALHGILHPNDMVDPYNMKMGDKGSVTPELVRQQARKHGFNDRTDVYTFLPKAYYKVLDKALRPLGIYAQDIYEADAGIGYQRGTCRIIRDTVKCMPANAEVVATLNDAIKALAGSKLDAGVRDQVTEALWAAVVELS